MRAVAHHPLEHGLHGRDTTIDGHSHSPFCDRQFAYREKKRGGSSDPPLANNCRRHRLVQRRTGGGYDPQLPARPGRRHTACARSFHPHRDPLCRLPQGNRSWIRRRRIARCAGRVLQFLFNQGGFIFEVQLGIIVVWAVFTDGHIQFLLFVCKTNVEEGRTTCKCGASCHISPQAFAAGQIHAGGRP